MKGIVRITLVAAILVGVSLPAPASAAVPSAVTWKVDHVNKTITVSVKLLLYPTCIASSSVRTDPCNVSEGIANRVREDILKVWNNSGKGYYYKCYKLIFEVDVKVANGANRFTVPKDRVGVQVDKSSVGFRSFVTVSKHGPWNSDDASDRRTRRTHRCRRRPGHTLRGTAGAVSCTRTNSDTSSGWMMPTMT